MAKRLSEKQVETIKNSFFSGISIEELSEKYNCSKLTITRNLKKEIGDLKYKEIHNINKNLKNKSKKEKSLKNKTRKQYSKKIDKQITQKNTELDQAAFIEIAPINFEIEISKQKDLSSIPLKSMDFKEVVYLIVDKKIELEIKFLNEYSEWQFLSKEDLGRKTIEIFSDLKSAKRNTNNNQKVIKIPNPNVLKIVAPILKSKGITRIINEDKLISL